MLESAIANAEHNHELIGDELKVARGLRRRGPDPQALPPTGDGRATRIRKRTSHLTVCLTPPETLATPKPKRAAKDAAEKKAPATKKPAAKPEADTKPETEAKPKAAKTKAEAKPKAAAKKPAADTGEKPKPKRTPRRRAKKTDEEASE